MMSWRANFQDGKVRCDTLISFCLRIAGRVAPMWIVPYAMTKAAIIALADGLSRELAKWKISVSTIEPTYYL